MHMRNTNQPSQPNQRRTEMVMKSFEITEKRDNVSWGMWAASSAKEAVQLLVADIVARPTAYAGFPSEITIVEVK